MIKEKRVKESIGDVKQRSRAKTESKKLIVSVPENYYQDKNPRLRLFRGHKGIISVDLNKARRAIRQTLEKNSAFFGGES